ncbi:MULTISPECIES: DUF397 domain-containing protein [unclassified Streptomyces]|uniref:DUF397 domain-containing protein n=1 Tax=unclassified Streptomyces TaxID=2593676 RepID=UPI002E1144D7|nr:DUF397 domain-containing protein [Streptomyces sp. NBC_01197]WSS50862.1 DUF397 domain-containing protein [Streptomyces sp. NBC_01180]
MHPRKRPRKNASATPLWFKSSYSSEQGGDCLEVAARPAAVHVRDSKNTDGPTLTLTPAAWCSFARFATSTGTP